MEANEIHGFEGRQQNGRKSRIQMKRARRKGGREGGDYRLVSGRGEIGWLLQQKDYRSAKLTRRLCSQSGTGGEKQLVDRDR